MEDEGYQNFVEENKEWLKDYVMYMAIKDSQKGFAWWIRRFWSLEVRQEPIHRLHLAATGNGELPQMYVLQSCLQECVISYKSMAELQEKRKNKLQKVLSAIK